jgi:sterol desaturase/sphingolipid hydroxylase (fatty acid hydroxylase superfamily)
MPADIQSALLVFGPFVLVASFLEAVVLSLRSRQQQKANPSAVLERYDWLAMGVSLFDQVGRHVMRLIPVTLATPAFVWAEQNQLYDIEVNTVGAVVGLFFAQEFLYYWYHRTAHRVRFFWANHAVHHSPNQLNLSAAYRLGWFGQFAGAAVFFTPLVWLGFDAEVVLSVVAINLLYQFWIHATWIPKLGCLEYVLNTPSAHRVHHASNLRYLDANYGGVLIIFDRLFGTYIEESRDEPCVYGWTKPVTTYNPLVIEIGPWVALFKDMVSARSPLEALAYLVMPPGWRADGPGETTAELRMRASHLPAAATSLDPMAAATPEPLPR